MTNKLNKYISNNLNLKYMLQYTINQNKNNKTVWEIKWTKTAG